MTQQPLAPQMWSFSVSIPVVRETSGESVQRPEVAVAALEDMRQAAQEMFVVLSLDRKNRIIDRTLVSLGTVDTSLVHPREVFRAAIVNGAASVIVAHNHPSGDATPSAEDVKITKQLVAAGQVLGIPVLDHVIIGRADILAPGFVSLRDKGYLNFSPN